MVDGSHRYGINSLQADEESPGGYVLRTRDKASAARSWRTLANADIGADLAAYALRVEVDPAQGQAATLVVLPTNSNTPQTVRCWTTETLPFGIKKITSVNGGATIPSWIGIQIAEG